MPVMNHNWSWL